MVAINLACFGLFVIICFGFLRISNCTQNEEDGCEAQIDIIQKRFDMLQNEFLKFGKQLSLLESNFKANLSHLTKQLRQSQDSSSSCYEGKSSSGLINFKASYNSKPITTFCETKTNGGGWIVIQQRVDNSISFKRGWTEYRNGFGNPTSNFWIGLENLHQLTSMDAYELLIELRFSNETLGNAHYAEFRIASEKEKYALVELGSFSGTVYDALRAHSGCNFSTFDRWNVEGYTGGMTWAQTDQGGWWYYSSYESQLNSGIERPGASIGKHRI